MKILKILGAGVAAIICFFIVVGAYLFITTKPMPDHAISDHDGILVLAHRGGRGLWPENTLFAFRKSVDLGADALDFDIHSLQDGSFVVIHDDTVNRTTNGTGNVSDFTLNDIQSLDAGYHWTDDNGSSYPYRGQGVQIPTLVEVFEEFPDTRMNIEIKTGQPDAVEKFCRLIHDYNKQDQTVVASFDRKVIQDFRNRCPDIATAAAAAEAWPFFVFDLLRLGKIYHPDAETMQVPAYRNADLLLTRRFVQTIHDHNMEIYVWTINDIEQMKTLIEMGVDGINTDYPDRLLNLLGRLSSEK